MNNIIQSLKTRGAFLFAFIFLFILGSCSISEHEMELPVENGARPIILSGSIDQIYTTRVSDGGFADGDKIGIYVVDYDGDKPGELKRQGNRADNLRFVFDEAAYKWIPDHDIYWKDDKTHIDIYGYYPYSSPESIEAYSFEVAKDQNSEAVGATLGGFEASDFLWGYAPDNSPTDKTITIPFTHRMASAKVTLNMGSGFEATQWATLEKIVTTNSAIRKASINLKTGEVTPIGDKPATGTIAMKNGNDFRCIIVPQTIAAKEALFSVTVGGITYSLKKADPFTFTPGKQHNFTITVNKRTNSGEYEFVLSGESITAWENDPASHNAVAREYVIVNVEEPGTLEEQIVASHKDPNKVVNLKITGNITGKDFGTIKAMAALRSLNLKEARIKKGEDGLFKDGLYEFPIESREDDVLPARALSHMPQLLRLILPDTLVGIDFEACYGCVNLTGSLVIPEGVTWIGQGAFGVCRSLTGSLSLPTTLERIDDGAFGSCGFNCELRLPESLTQIRDDAFGCCSGLYGTLHLPSHLTVLGSSSFRECGFTGNLEIPQTLTEIGGSAFLYTHFNGFLTLHDGITAIGGFAFGDCGFRGELTLPKNLVVLSENCFSGCDFSGNLVLPEDVAVIGRAAFANNWRLMGTVTIPKSVQSIGELAFSNCWGLEGLILEEGVETIGKGAFEMCYGLGSIVVKGSVPPYIQSGAFNGVPKDNFAVEVPESSLQLYQTEPGWSEFKRITAHRELVVRPALATAINTSITRDLVINAEGDWTITSKPDWVSLDKTSGSKKSEVKVTFSELPSGSEPRSGKIIFKLKDKDYTASCSLTQYDYLYSEDEVITLNSSSKGDNINLVILGDGFNAKDISEGKLLASTTEAFKHFFDIEPYKTYKEYFNVYTAVSVSAESGVGGVNTILYNRFNTTFKGGVGLGGRNGDSDLNEIMKYACKAPTVNEGNLSKTLVIIVPNTTEYGGICYMYEDGFALAYCPMSDYGYPLDFRGVVQHEAGGHGFGKLGDEYIYHHAFIDMCDCSCCGHVLELSMAKANGWYPNLSLSGKMNEVEWSHLIFHEKYTSFVDIFEGGFMHTRGVFRSEQNSCMNNDIPYYSTISRESIVRRIKQYAGEEFSFDDFVANDVTEAYKPSSTKGFCTALSRVSMESAHSHPQFMGERPVIVW